MSVKPNSTEILISGAGPAGLTLALGLGRAGFSTTIADPRPVGPEGGVRGAPGAGRVYLVAAGCWRIFDALGVGEKLRQVAEPVLEVAAAAGSDAIAFDGHDAGAGDALGYVIENAALVDVLGAAVLETANVEVRAPAGVTELAIGAAGVRAGLGDSGDVAARLVVGCDGVRSAVRAATDIGFEGWDYDYQAVSTVMTCPDAHGGRARQAFLRGGPIAALPMTEGRVNVVWSVKSAIAEALVAMSDAAFEAELDRQAPGFLPDARLAGPRGAFALSNRIASRFHAERVALAGDSAHIVHPLAGQGLNLGLKDVAALIDVITEADRVGLDIGSEAALIPYTQWRRADVVATAAAMEGFHRAFTAPRPVRMISGAAMRAAGGVRGARSMFAKEAAGVLGETPSLMRAPAA